MKKISRKTQKGFTLVETLIAIFILTLAITGPIYIASFALRNTIDSRDNIVAQHLAEEVIEVVRNRRDKIALDNNPDVNWIAVTDSANCFNGVNGTDNKCEMVRVKATNDYQFNSCSGGTCPNLYFDPSPTATVIYGDADGSGVSKFTRELYFQKEVGDTSGTNVPNNEAKLVVNIKWIQKGQPKIYTLTERLYAINYSQFFNK